LTTKAVIGEFLDQKILAIVGMSRSEKKFSSMLYKNLKVKGYRLFAVNPNTANNHGEACFDSILSLPEKVDGVVIVTPPNQTEKVVREAISAGIKYIWIQQGAESQEAIDFCEKKGINVIHNQCVLMFAEPSGFPHKLHQFTNSGKGRFAFICIVPEEGDK